MFYLILFSYITSDVIKPTLYLGNKMIFHLVIHQCAVREAAVQNNCKPVATAVGKYRIDIIGQMKTGKEMLNG